MHSKYESMCPTLAKRDTSVFSDFCLFTLSHEGPVRRPSLARYACKQGHGDEAKSTVKGLAVRISTLTQPQLLTRSTGKQLVVSVVGG